jgi:mannose-1-phosphate guanylyltransferase
LKALILAAGEGARLRPLTLATPKPMLPISGVPLLALTVMSLRHHGITDLAINLHYHPEVITNHFETGQRYGVNITYSFEPQLLGSAGAAKKLQSFLAETFLVIYGDVLTNMDYDRLTAFHRAVDALVTLSLYRVDNPTEVGLVGIDDTGRVTRFLEKPRPEDVFTDLASSGVLVCEPQILDRVPPARFCDFGQHLLPQLLTEGSPLYGLPISNREYLVDIGTPEKYAHAQIEWPRLQAGAVPASRSVKE